MRIRSPSLPELHAFISVVKTGSFSRAAEELSVTQGAVSRAVLRLESRLGLTLLERGGAGTQLTAAGETYYGRIHEAVAALEDAVPRQSGVVPEQELRLSVVPSLNMRWLVPRLPSLHAEHPWLRIVFKPYWFEEDFLRTDVDCWIKVRKAPTSRWPRHIQATYLIGKEIVPICHPSIAHRIKRPADLLNFELLHHANTAGNWAIWLRASGVDTERLKLGPGFDLGATLIEAVEANAGVAVIQPCLIERELAENRVAVPLNVEVSNGRGYYLCVPRAKSETLALVTFRQWLLGQINKK